MYTEKTIIYNLLN